MRIDLAAILVLFLMVPAAEQVICTLGANAYSYNAYSDQSPSPDASQLARPVNAALAALCRPNCPTIEMFRNPTAANAMVVVAGTRSKIVYNPDFFTAVYGAHGDIAIQVILAHELGHAIDAASPVAWVKREWSPELRADAWTGCALARLNPGPRPIKAALEVLAKYTPAGAPDWAARLQVLRVGYTQCGGDVAKWG
jgi:hypothetical protein